MEPKELSEQLKKPTGKNGLEVARALNESNQGLYDLAFKLLELKPNQNILEIGFGNGKHFSQYIQKEPELTLTGVDYSADMCEEAKASNTTLIDEDKLTIQCAETSALPFSNDEFDVIIAHNVIYFLNPPEPHLQEIKRVLKPGGLFLIGHRPRHSIEHLEFTRHHFVLYEADELVELMKTNGFMIADQHSNSYQKSAVDGTSFQVTDACLLVKKKTPSSTTDKGV
ncbi:class I SAM-dependent methyltransferase [Gracilimonas sediminicola]|uniref:Class I SAM-dependent methyltransferase n=1 Tax=Gracilimonas sediminicola TaxID=2952158 RepID=A0A9X2REN8_9BACT|nr:class I SAM-dependent methyltransferase [Gracilimonas sediminicola]MCP9292136.1 class I SAM-dependent methyltransferase [Gracilimonas sediminicola]